MLEELSSEAGDDYGVYGLSSWKLGREYSYPNFIHIFTK